jgi:hypothetical protein
VDAADDEDPRPPRAEGEVADRLPARTLAGGRRADPVARQPDVHVVVVVNQFLDDRRRPFEACTRADEHLRGSGSDEARDEILGQLPIDLARGFRWTLSPVAPRVVDVDVQPVLV